MIGVRYETSPDQMRELLWRLRRMLLDHPNVDADPARVRFVNFAAYSLDVEIFVISMPTTGTDTSRSRKP